jgi:hypothetical protein
MLSADYGREARMMWKLAVAALVSSGGIVVSGQPQHAAPSLSLAATQRPAIEFATALLRASIPCGVEVREADDLPISAGAVCLSLGVTSRPARRRVTHASRGTDSHLLSRLRRSPVRSRGNDDG